jgi:hypothetical protein
MKRSPSYRHVILNKYFAVIGARIAEAGKCFVVREEGQSRERLFLIEQFEMNITERGALFETLLVKEVARIKVAAKKDLALKFRARRTEDEDDEPQEEIQELQVTTFNRENECESDVTDTTEEKDTESIVEPEQIAAD